MKFSDNIFYRGLYFSLPVKEESLLRKMFVALLKGNKNILIDCGVSYHFPDIVQLAAEADLKLSDIDIVIITHCHADHTGGLFKLKQENPNIKIWTHPLCKPMIENIDEQFKIRPVPAFYHLMGGSVKVDREIEDGEEIDIGYLVKIIYTPGHSNDSISLCLPDEKMIISGDAIPYINDMPIYEDLNALKASLEKMKKYECDYIISAFSGLWDNNSQGNIFTVTEKHLQTIQSAVDDFQRDFPNSPLEEMGSFVLKRINNNSFPVPIFLTSLKEHIKQK